MREGYPSSRNASGETKKSMWDDPQVYDNVLTHQCGYVVHVHFSMHGFKVTSGKMLTEVMISWAFSEVTYYDTDGKEITYCPGCGRTFLVLGRVESNGGST